MNTRIVTTAIATAATLAAGSLTALAHSGHGAMIVDGHAHGGELVAVLAGVAGVALLVKWLCGQRTR